MGVCLYGAHEFLLNAEVFAVGAAGCAVGCGFCRLVRRVVLAALGD
jgi:hypothetical protein